MGLTLLKNADASGVYFLPAPRRAAIESSSNRLHFKVLTADIAEYSSAEAVLFQLGSALNFPIWYGSNFDALFDCLTDPDWEPAKGHVLLISGISRLRTTDPDDFATLLEVFQAAAEAHREMQSPFWILIDSPARGIPTFPEA